MPGRREDAADTDAGTGRRAVRGGPAPAPACREPPAVLHASRGSTSILAAACTKALNAKSGGRSHQQQRLCTSPPSTPAALASRARGDAWARLACVCELQGPAQRLLWAQTLCHGERGCSPHTRVLSRRQSHQRRGTRWVLLWHISVRAAVGACCQSELPRHHAQSRSVSPVWEQRRDGWHASAPLLYKLKPRHGQ